MLLQWHFLQLGWISITPLTLYCWILQLNKYFLYVPQRGVILHDCSHTQRNSLFLSVLWCIRVSLCSGRNTMPCRVTIVILCVHVCTEIFSFSFCCMCQFVTEFVFSIQVSNGWNTTCNGAALKVKLLHLTLLMLCIQHPFLSILFFV